jgi:uncharacterized protein (TIGR02271 family)
MSQREAKLDDQTQVIPVVEEILDVQKRRIETGGVRIKKAVSEREEHVDEPIWWEEIDVQRKAVDHVVEGPVPQIRTEGDLLIIPVLEEVVVVKKQLILKEELHITKRRLTAHASRTITLRREEATVERLESTHQDNQEQKKSLP